MADEPRKLTETRLHGKTVYRGRILDLHVDTVRLPTGNETVREVVRHRGAAVVLPLHEDGRVLLVRQYRYPTGEVLLELPAGKIDPGEGPEVCAARELEEETGWRGVEVHALGSFLTTPGFTDEVLHAFIATPLAAADGGRRDPDEAIEVVEMELQELLEACRSGRIRDSKTLATILLAQLEGWI